MWADPEGMSMQAKPVTAGLGWAFAPSCGAPTEEAARNWRHEGCCSFKACLQGLADSLHRLLGKRTAVNRGGGRQASGEALQDDAPPV